MGDSDLAEIISELTAKINKIEERLRAVEAEQRKIREDILSGNPKERMHKRILNKSPEKIENIRKKIDNEIKIQI